ncbi:MAG: hypothetical protein D6828_00550, partial [Nitrospirae bacterium]
KKISEDDELIKYIKSHCDITERAEDAELIIVLGGDGGMLKAIRAYRDLNLPFAGLNYGHIGFLMNRASIQSVEEFLRDEMEIISVKTLEALIYDKNGTFMGIEYAFNDFYFERATTQVSKIRVTLNGKVRFDPLIGDGVIVCTSAGSTAYNASAGGIILPIGTNSMVLTGICPAVFQHWRTAQLPADSVVILEPIMIDERPVRFLADGIVKKGVAKAVIKYSDKIVKVAFARSQDFREKVFELQFERRKI